MLFMVNGTIFYVGLILVFVISVPPFKDVVSLWVRGTKMHVHSVCKCFILHYL